jgi:hypothetical protein
VERDQSIARARLHGIAACRQRRRREKQAGTDQGAEGKTIKQSLTWGSSEGSPASSHACAQPARICTSRYSVRRRPSKCEHKDGRGWQSEAIDACGQ